VVASRARWIGERRGKTRIGCLLSLLVFAVVVYYGVGVGGVYLQYWRLLDDMHSQANYAPNIDDATILRRLRSTVEELKLPPEARNITIRRTTRPREIVIRTEYKRALRLPFYQLVVTFKPEVRASL
jgi:hypothetical protein